MRGETPDKYAGSGEKSRGRNQRERDCRRCLRRAGASEEAPAAAPEACAGFLSADSPCSSMSACSVMAKPQLAQVQKAPVGWRVACLHSGHMGDLKQSVSLLWRVGARRNQSPHSMRQVAQSCPRKA